MQTVAERLAAVRARIVAASASAGRDPASVRLIAVSKRQPVAAIREAYAAGQRDFGENYAQELRDKAAELADLTDLRWHFIGALQRNKVQYVAKAASAFHALETAEIAAALGQRVAGAIPCFVEVNVGGESSKHGLRAERLADVLPTLAAPGVQIVGLMTMPPWSPDPESSRPAFRALATLAASHGLTRLSMGTTEDFEVAIAEGATEIRVGRSIFGERPRA